MRLQVHHSNHDDGKFCLVLSHQSDSRNISSETLVLDALLLRPTEDALLLATLLLAGEKALGTEVQGVESSRSLFAGLAGQLGANVPQVSLTHHRSDVPSQCQLFITTKHYDPPLQPSAGPRRVVIQVLDSANWTGRLFSLDSVTICANLSYFNWRERPTAAVLGAVGVLLASDWNSTEVFIESDEPAGWLERGLGAAANQANWCLKFLNPREFKEALERVP